jgi:type IV pilus assembly protein PilO
MAITKEDIIKLPKPKKALILAGIIFLIGCIFFTLIYNPKRSELSKTIDQVNKIRAEVQQKRKAAKDLEKYRAEVAQLGAELKRALSQLPDEKEIPSLLKSITEIAKKTGLETTFFKQETNVRKNYYSEIPVTIKVIGDYHNVAYFLYQVGSMPRILQFSKLNMTGIKKDEARATLEASLTATTYKFEPEPLPEKKEKKK